MIRKGNQQIFSDLSDDKIEYWFSKKEKKFLHNIDTFYYTVKLYNDFRVESEDISCIKFRQFFRTKYDRSTYNSFFSIDIPDVDVQLNYIPFKKHGTFYDIDISCPDMYDIFFASSVPPGADGNESVTTEIVVQLRSAMLWQIGLLKSFEQSYDTVTKICKYFDLEIAEVKENRVDYCWHSNYIQNPDRFFSPDSMAKRIVTTLGRKDRKGLLYHVDVTPTREVEIDYIAVGRRSQKCFVRIYMKSKEVIEQGYKGWFLQEWLYNNLISRYDFYVYEKAYIKKSWNYVDVARLEYYSEYGADPYYRQLCADIVAEKVEKNSVDIIKLADKLTPRVTIITNVEFQTTRKMSKNFCLIQLRDNENKEECKRIYDYIDNRALIAEYLTACTFRLAEPSDTDVNISRADNCQFWNALRSCKMVDVKHPPKNIKLKREYTRNLNKELVKKRMLNSMVTLSIYEKGFNDDDGRVDAMDVITMLNDNDMKNMMQTKIKRKQQLNKFNFESSTRKIRNYVLYDNDTGEIIW